jgi:hypothetical protein
MTRTDMQKIIGEQAAHVNFLKEEVEFYKSYVKAVQITLRHWAPQVKSVNVTIRGRAVDLVGEVKVDESEIDRL